MSLMRRVKQMEQTRARFKDKHKDALLQEIMDWHERDPKADELSQLEDEYCKAKGYPLLSNDTLDFYEQLNDPAYEKMNNEYWVAFDQWYRKKGGHSK